MIQAVSAQKQMQFVQGLGQVGQLRLALAGALAGRDSGFELASTRKGRLRRPFLIDQKWGT